MKKIDCSTAQSWMIAHLDNGLDAIDLNCLQRHIDECPVCRRTHDATVELFSKLRAAEPPDPGEVFWTHYDTSLKAFLHEHDLDRERRTLLWRTISAVLVAGTIFLAVTVGVVSHLPQQTARSPEVEPAVIEELASLYGPTFEEEMNMEAGSNTIATAAAETTFSDELVPWFEVEEDEYPLLPPGV